jgi:hypothetical protein
MPSVFYSTDGGANWLALGCGDDWPTTVGAKIIRLQIPPTDGLPRHRMSFKITDNGVTTWGLKSASVVVKQRPQIKSRNE